MFYLTLVENHGLLVPHGSFTIPEQLSRILGPTSSRITGFDLVKLGVLFITDRKSGMTEET